MQDKRAELLSYVRTLYERESSRASKNGMTFWAILVGIIYLVWPTVELLSQIQDISAIKLNFYLSFSQVHLALLAASAIVSTSGQFQHRRAYDYRIKPIKPSSVNLLLSIILFIIAPLWFIFKSQNMLPPNSWVWTQQKINFWCLIIFITLLLLGAFLETKRSRKNVPSIVGIFAMNKKYNSFFSIVLTLLFIEILGGNLVGICLSISEYLYTINLFHLAFNLSLISIGICMLNGFTSSKGYLLKLSTLERDIVLHELNEKDISERLKDEFLGHYIEDWVESSLKKTREKLTSFEDTLNKANSVVTEIKNIDGSYTHERQGRVNAYIEELETKFIDYNETVIPLLDWLDDLTTHNALYKDDFIQTIAKSCITELKSSYTRVTADSKKIKNEFDELLRKI